ncbi:hypothetical protein BC831DRAFT_442398 [Entophlyctis helioformis]|nr:hypothetical protein BC831DRAFT_442398 [Entophlyctis helioformis]
MDMAQPAAAGPGPTDSQAPTATLSMHLKEQSMAYSASISSSPQSSASRSDPRHQLRTLHRTRSQLLRRLRAAIDREQAGSPHRELLYTAALTISAIDDSLHKTQLPAGSPPQTSTSSSALPSSSSSSSPSSSSPVPASATPAAASASPSAPVLERASSAAADAQRAAGFSTSARVPSMDADDHAADHRLDAASAVQLTDDDDASDYGFDSIPEPVSSLSLMSDVGFHNMMLASPALGDASASAVISLALGFPSLLHTAGAPTPTPESAPRQASDFSSNLLASALPLPLAIAASPVSANGSGRSPAPGTTTQAAQPSMANAAPSSTAPVQASTSTRLVALDEPAASKKANLDKYDAYAAQDTQFYTRTCRFCLDDESNGILISPCLCSGSAKYVHVHCLQQWRKMAINPYSRIRCEICHAYYPIKYPFSGLVTITSARVVCGLTYLTYSIMMLFMFRWMFSAVGVSFHGSRWNPGYLAEMDALTFGFASWQQNLIAILAPIGPCILLVGAYHPTAGVSAAARHVELVMWWIVMSLISNFQVTMMCLTADFLFLFCTLYGSAMVVARTMYWADNAAPRLLILLSDVYGNDVPI